MNNNKNEGFTLIELLLVIGVLGILSSIAIPRLANIRDKAHDAKIAVVADHIKTGLEAYYQDNNQYPAENDVDNNWDKLDQLLINVELGDVEKYNIGDKHADVSDAFTYTITEDGNYEIEVGSNSTGTIYIISNNQYKAE